MHVDACGGLELDKERRQPGNRGFYEDEMEDLTSHSLFLATR